MTTSGYLRAANQPPSLEGYDLFSEDRALVEALRREGGAGREDECAAFGRLCGGEPLELGRLANENPPKLRRDDEVEFHPAWHALLGLGVENGLHAYPWADPEPGAHVARAAKFILLAEAEAGVGCPLSMTYSAVPALRAEPAVAAEWEPLARLAREAGHPRGHGAHRASGWLGRAGERDARGAERRRRLRLNGQKWFCSAPMCDAFLVLAQAPGGLTCFLLPRVLPDGERNGFRIERLKDKLGNRSNASAEIVLVDAWATRLGEEGRGIATIIEMVVHTRLDCVLGATALMRRAVAEATHHAAYRSVFGRLLAEQPLHVNVLADLCLDSEAATATALRLARAVDEDDRAVPPARDRGREVLGLQVDAAARRGGARVPRRERLRRGVGAPAALPREPAQLAVGGRRQRERARPPARGLARAGERGGAARRDRARRAAATRGSTTRSRRLEAELGDEDEREYRARRVVELAALCLQGSLLVRHAPPEVADAFCADPARRRGRPRVRDAPARRRRGGDRRAAPAAARRLVLPAMALEIFYCPT